MLKILNILLFYIYVCMYVNVYIYVNVYMCICMYAYTFFLLFLLFFYDSLKIVMSIRRMYNMSLLNYT